MNGYHRNPNNQSFVRYTVYDQSRLVFTSLDRSEAIEDCLVRSEMRGIHLDRFLRANGLPIQMLYGTDSDIIVKEEVCNLKGYVINSKTILNGGSDGEQSRIYPDLRNVEVPPHLRTVEYNEMIRGSQPDFNNQPTFNNQPNLNNQPDFSHLQMQQSVMENMRRANSTAEPKPQPVSKKVLSPEEKLEAEMAKLASNLSKFVENETQEGGIDVEEVYPDLKEEIQMDKEIAEMENEFIDDTDSYSGSEDSDNYYDQMMKIRTHQSDSDSDSDEFGDRRRRHERGEFSDDEQDPDEIPENIPDHLKEQFEQLIAARNAISDRVKTQEELVKKANENLNEEQFKERCRIQDERRAKKKKEEELSIMSANKITYLKLRSKITKGIVKETNIPFMFNDKYTVLRYMEMNELIDLGANDEIEAELEIYNALYKAIEAREYEEMSHDSESDSDYTPLEDVDEDMIDFCYDFLDFLEEKFPNTVSESKIHFELNKEMQVDDEIFRRDINNAAVSRHDADEDNDNGSEDSGVYDRQW